MSKPRIEKNLKLALDYRDILLWQITNGNMGAEPKIPIVGDTTTFSEKKAFLDTMLKAAAQVRQSNDGVEETSGFDLIRKKINDGKTSRSEGNPWNPGEGPGSETGNDDEGEIGS